MSKLRQLYDDFIKNRKIYTATDGKEFVCKEIFESYQNDIDGFNKCECCRKHIKNEEKNVRICGECFGFYSQAMQRAIIEYNITKDAEDNGFTRGGMLRFFLSKKEFTPKNIIEPKTEFIRHKHIQMYYAEEFLRLKKMYDKNEQ